MRQAFSIASPIFFCSMLETINSAFFGSPVTPSAKKLEQAESYHPMWVAAMPQGGPHLFRLAGLMGRRPSRFVLNNYPAFEKAKRNRNTSLPVLLDKL